MRNYQNMVFGTAVRLLANQSEAEDISQEVFLKAYERFAELRDSPTAGGWLKTVARNMSLNHLSRYRARWTFFSEMFHRSGDEEEGVLHACAFRNRACVTPRPMTIATQMTTVASSASDSSCTRCQRNESMATVA